MEKKPEHNQASLGHGIGLRSEHFQEILENKPRVDWFEAISENFMDTQGRPIKILEKIRSDYPVGLHGTSLSIGSAAGLNPHYLQNLKRLVDRIQPSIVSDHLSWSENQDERLFDLLPLPFTHEAVRIVCENVDQLQNYLRRRILLENVSAYISFKHSEMQEWDFLNEVAKRSGCGILLDVNNIHVNAFNHGFKGEDYLSNLNPLIVEQYHISGHTDKGKFLFDTHTGDVIQPVWQLYAAAVRRFGDISSLIEWDTEIRGLNELIALNEKSRSIAADIQRAAAPEYTEASLSSLSSEAPVLGDIQDMFAAEMLGRHKTSLENYLNPQAGDPGIARLEVYSEGYPARIAEALAESYPAVSKVIGEEVFAEIALQFSKSQGFEHYNLNAVAPFFAEYLKLSPLLKTYPFLSDLAALEKAVHLTFHAAVLKAATPQDFADKAAINGENLVFHFQPHVFLTRSDWPVLDIWAARHQPSESFSIQLENRPQSVLTYKRDDKVFCQLLEKTEGAVLEQLIRGETLSRAFDVMTDADDMTPVQAWFSKWIGLGLMTDFEWKQK